MNTANCPLPFRDSQAAPEVSAQSGILPAESTHLLDTSGR